MSELGCALEQMRFARVYTLRLLDSVEPEDWFRLPPSSVSHIAWQVGHLAMAQYRLVLERIRGRRYEDEALISEAFLNQFGRNSVPQTDVNCYPTAKEIRAVLDGVHAQAQQEIPNIPEASLSDAPLKPHPLCQTKGQVLFWCSAHEMLHAGQIGLIRRQLGYPPVW